MTVHPTGEPVSSANYPDAETLLLTIGRSGVLSCRAIAEKEFDTLLRLLGPPSERQCSEIRRAVLSRRWLDLGWRSLRGSQP